MRLNSGEPKFLGLAELHNLPRKFPQLLETSELGDTKPMLFDDLFHGGDHVPAKLEPTLFAALLQQFVEGLNLLLKLSILILQVGNMVLPTPQRLLEPFVGLQ